MLKTQKKEWCINKELGDFTLNWKERGDFDMNRYNGYRVYNGLGCLGPSQETTELGKKYEF